MKKTCCQPNYAITPGETLRETLEAIGMTQTELAHLAGFPTKTINKIVTGNAVFTADTAFQLERVLEIPASFWNNLEKNYQETKARLKEEEELEKIAKKSDSVRLF
jgi:HTH-type transcriptional regulator/antitoxin HigA